MTDELEIDSGIQPDAPGDLQRLEQLIAGDEAADQRAADLRSAEAAKAQESGRDGQGRFTKGASASGPKANAQRAGERLTPEEIKAQPGQRPAAANGTDGQPTTEQQQQQQPATNQQAKPEGGEANASPEDKSTYRKEIERREKSWQELNKQKEEFKAQQAQFDIEKQTVIQREQALRRVPKRNGFTAEQFEAGVQKFENLAAHYEQQGDYAKADEQRQLAENAKAAAADLRRQAPGAARTSEQNWALLKADLPEALNTANPLNQELRALIQQRPDLLADEAGPFRVAVLAGRKLVAGLENQLNASKAEAGKVPGLQAEVAKLSARVQELEGLTSPGGEGGGGAANRGSGREKSPAEMTTAELEQSIERSLAGAY